jgi:pyruvate dehydrogenase E1 component alpha subunit
MTVTRNNKMAVDLYKDMYRIRQFDTMASKLFAEGQLAGNIHTCIGQEAVCVGACRALAASDFITATHRGHGHCLAKGGDSRLMMAELFGRSTGYCHGKGGSMHIANVDLGIMGANGIVGAGIPIAVGSALASRIRGTGEVTLCFFGDAASNQGSFHEAVNMAAAWKLPCVFLCENNLYGVSVNIHRVTSVADIAERAKAYNIPGVVADGNDVFAVMAAVETAVERARKGDGPSLVECKTYRQHGHYEGDPQTYRPREELEKWKQRDPVVLLRQEILASGMAGEGEVAALEEVVDREIGDAVAFAKESPWPDASEATTCVYSSDNDRSVAR